MLLSKIEILALDDDPLILRFLQKVLERMGVVFNSASTAHEGIEIFRKKPDHISLILLDLSLPDQEWRQTVTDLKIIRPDIRIVISSGSVIQDQSHESDPRIFCHLPKPFAIPELIKLLESIDS